MGRSVPSRLSVREPPATKVSKSLGTGLSRHACSSFVVFSWQENAKIDTVRSLAEGLEDGYPVVEDVDLPMEE